MIEIQHLKTNIMLYNLDYSKENVKDKFIHNLKKLRLSFRQLKDETYAYKLIDDKLVVSIMRTSLDEIPSIEDKNILFTEDFLNVFNDILESILFINAFRIGNIGKYIQEFIESINNITISNYVISDCSNVNKDIKSKFSDKISEYDYNCGRAIMQINKENSRFLIFNTRDDALPDLEIVNKYRE